MVPHTAQAFSSAAVEKMSTRQKIKVMKEMIRELDRLDHEGHEKDEHYEEDLYGPWDLFTDTIKCRNGKVLNSPARK